MTDALVEDLAVPVAEIDGDDAASRCQEGGGQSQQRTRQHARQEREKAEPQAKQAAKAEAEKTLAVKMLERIP